MRPILKVKGVKVMVKVKVKVKAKAMAKAMAKVRAMIKAMARAATTPITAGPAVKSTTLLITLNKEVATAAKAATEVLNITTTK